MTDQVQSDYQALNELEIMAQAQNYNAWIWRTISPYMGNSIIEIGAGIGTFTHYLENKKRVFATDVAQNCIDVLSRLFQDQPCITVEELDITRPPDMQFWIPREVDTIICLNVLEHIDDDIGALKNMKEMIKPGAHIILMVPAFQCAYGTIDKLDGHFRRYSRSELKSKMLQAGLETVRLHYFNSVGLLAWFYTNKIARNRTTSANKVKVYDKYIVPWLRLFEGVVKPPFGQSLIAVGKKL
jgi:2-polyprenyl-3-methyl-5-hydroxy-6-metoxy-1,4-benzoquinol methylase